MTHESGAQWHNVQGKRENEVILSAPKPGKVSLCWRKIDRKSKKLNFSFNVAEEASSQIAGQDTIQSLQKDLQMI